MDTGFLSPGIKRPGREADHSPSSSAEFTNTWIYISTSQYDLTARCLVKHRHNFIFTFTFTEVIKQCNEVLYDGLITS